MISTEEHMYRPIEDVLPYECKLSLQSTIKQFKHVLIS